MCEYPSESDYPEVLHVELDPDDPAQFWIVTDPTVYVAKRRRKKFLITILHAVGMLRFAFGLKYPKKGQAGFGGIAFDELVVGYPEVVTNLAGKAITEGGVREAWRKMRERPIYIELVPTSESLGDRLGVVLLNHITSGDTSAFNFDPSVEIRLRNANQVEHAKAVEALERVEQVRLSRSEAAGGKRLVQRTGVPSDAHVELDVVQDPGIASQVSMLPNREFQRLATSAERIWICAMATRELLGIASDCLKLALGSARLRECRVLLLNPHAESIDGRVAQRWGFNEGVAALRDEFASRHGSIKKNHEAILMKALNEGGGLTSKSNVRLCESPFSPEFILLDSSIACVTGGLPTRRVSSESVMLTLFLGKYFRSARPTRTQLDWSNSVGGVVVGYKEGVPHIPMTKRKGGGYVLPKGHVRILYADSADPYADADDPYGEKGEAPIGRKESHKETALREIREEVGIASNLEIGRLIDTYREPHGWDLSLFKTVHIYFVRYCRNIESIDLKTDYDHEEARWFPADNLPKLHYEKWQRPLIQEALRLAEKRRDA